MTAAPRAAAIVTGAAGGMGRAIVRALLDEELALVATDRDADGLAALTGQPDRLRTLCGDIADPVLHDRLVDTALGAFGRLDGLVHAAGVSVAAVGDLLEVTPEAYRRCLTVNAEAAFFLMQRVARQLLATPEGTLPRFMVTITSSNATAVSIRRSEYCVSKAAASMATQCFAARLGGEGIGVFEIRPGVIATPMTASRLADYEQRIAEQDLTVTRRVGLPEEVAACVATAALGRLPYTVGQVISVDGGLTGRRY